MRSPAIIGLDLSVKATGKIIRLQSGEFESARILDSGGTNVQRNQNMVQAICKGILPGDLVFIEDYYVRFIGSAVKLIELGGIVKLAITNITKSEPFLVHSATLKKYAWGKGKGEKDEIMYAVSQTWGHEFNSSDECDAWILTEIGAALCGWSDDNMTKKRRECLESVKEYGENPKKWKTFLDFVSRSL